MQTENVFFPNAAAVAKDLLLHSGTLWLAVNRDTEILFVFGFLTVINVINVCTHIKMPVFHLMFDFLRNYYYFYLFMVLKEKSLKLV